MVTDGCQQADNLIIASWMAKKAGAKHTYLYAIVHQIKPQTRIFAKKLNVYDYCLKEKCYLCMLMHCHSTTRHAVSPMDKSIVGTVGHKT